MANKTQVNLIQSEAMWASGVIYPTGITHNQGDGWYQDLCKRLMERKDKKEGESKTLKRYIENMEEGCYIFGIYGEGKYHPYFGSKGQKMFQ